jgi:hypothetical protein
MSSLKCRNCGEHISYRSPDAGDDRCDDCIRRRDNELTALDLGGYCLEVYKKIRDTPCGVLTFEIPQSRRGALRKLEKDANLIEYVGGRWKTT